MPSYTLSDYTQLGKDYKARGRKQSLWEEFLTGTQSYFQQQAQQVQDVHSYDISQAYANYKKQQLQLQMNERLGAGFQQQAGTELQTAYGQTYQDIKTQEASTLAKIAEQEATELQKGEAEFEELGATLKQVESLYEDFAAEADVRKPKESEMYTISKDAQGNQTYELTDIGRLWYYNVQQASVNGQTFDDWLAADDDRLALADFMKQRPDLVAGTITGLTRTATGDYDFDIESTQAKWDKLQYNTPIYSSGIIAKGDSSSMNDNAGDDFKLKYNGKTYKVEKGKDADPELKTKLTDEFRDSQGRTPKFKDTMIYQGQIYIYLYNNNRNEWEWNAIRGRKNNKSGYDKLLADLGITEYQQKTGTPSAQKTNRGKSTSDSSRPSASSGGLDMRQII